MHTSLFHQIECTKQCFTELLNIVMEKYCWWLARSQKNVRTVEGLTSLYCMLVWCSSVRFLSTHTRVSSHQLLCVQATVEVKRAGAFAVILV